MKEGCLPASLADRSGPAVCGELPASRPRIAGVTFSDAFTVWTLSPLGTLLSVLLAGGYAVGWARMPRAQRPALWRLVGFMLLGPLALLYSVDGFMGAWRGDSFLVAASQSAFLAAVVPVGVAMGDPLSLRSLSSATGPGRWVRRMLTSWLGKFLFLPLLSSVLAAVVHLLMFTTDWLALSVEHPWIRETTYFVLPLTGVFVTLPLMAEDFGPVWLSDPFKAFIAFMESAVDAAPALIVLTASHWLARPVPGYLEVSDPIRQYNLGGGAMLAIAETVGLPLLIATVVQWSRSDHEEALRVDAESSVEQSFILEDEVPWWEQDPRLASRYVKDGR